MQTIKFEIQTTAAGHKIGVIQLNRPQAMNALNKQLLSELKDLVVELGKKREIRVAILTGSGEKAFVAGADIKEMQNLSAAEGRQMAVAGQALLQKLEDLPFPVIAVVNGFALGGGLELALACDFIVASTGAKWGLPEVTLGLIPGYGGTQRLSRVVGRAIARRVALSGEIFTAQQGYEWGLFTQICGPTELLATATKLAETLSTRAPLALGWVKEAINHGHDRSLAEGLRLEADLFGRTFETKDHNEGIQAFVEKRTPNFQGH